MIKTSLHLKTAASANLLTTAEAKTHLREELTDATNDAYIDTLVAAAQQAVENFTNRKLTATTYYMYLSAFPVDGIVLPFNPVSAITAITYYDTANSLQTLSATAYQYKIYEEPLVISAVDDSWPATYDDRNDAVIVEFVTGYTSPDTCPDALKHAVKLLTGDLYSNRTNILKERFELWQMLATPHRVFHSTMENQ